MLHYKTAYKIFLDKPTFGQGLKSFRYLCGDKKYSLQEEIFKDNTIVATFDGTFSYQEFERNSKKFFIFGIIDKKNTFKKLGIRNVEDNFYYSAFKDGDEVKAGETIVSHYEYNNGCNTHPHNIMLQVLAELGLFGLLFFLAMYLYVVYHLILLFAQNIIKKVDKVSACKFFILLGIFSTMTPLFPSGNYFNNWLLLITYFPIGFYLSLIKFESK